MKRDIRSLPLLLSTIGLAVVSWQCAGTNSQLPPPPSTKIITVVDSLHGHAIEDHYRWLEDQDSDETRAWIDEQNKYTKSIIGSLPGREKLAARLGELLKIDKISIPTERNGRYFLSKRAADQDLYVIYKREGLDGKDEVLIDPHPMSEDHSTSVGISDISLDGQLLAYSIRKGGQDEVEIHFLNVDSGEELPDILPHGEYFGVALTPDKMGLYYSSYDQQTGSRIYLHRMGSDFSKDKLIFGESYGPEKIIGIDLSENGRYLTITVYYGSSGEKTEIYYKDISADGPIRTLVNDIEARFYGTVVDDKVYMQTDWEAPNRRILVADLKNPSQGNWKEVVPTSELVLHGFSLVGGKICARYLDTVKSQVKIFDAEGNYIRNIAFPNIGTVGGISGNWDSDNAFFTFSSFNSPSTIYRYNVSDGETLVWSRPDIEVNSENIEIKQVWYKSADGTSLPMFVVHQKGLKLDGNNPTLLYGYGGFNSSQTPYFSTMALTWMENGGVWVSTNLRGGGEFGEEWHEAAMFEKKQNSFDDFIAAAEWLIDNGYTNPSKLAIRGGSNGGLLVGACMTQRPDLFRAVVCTYPLLDMLRYHRFMVGKFWVSEYGSADEPDQFEYIYKYSPYHRVVTGVEYPAVLFITGDGDTRVDPCHARKMTALMQAANGSANPIMIRYEIKAGHSGGRPIGQIVDDTAEELSFLFWQLGAELE